MNERKHNFTSEEINLIKELIDQKKTYREISEIMDRSKNSIISKCQRLKIKGTRYPHAKYTLIYEDILTYFLTHSSLETAEHFNLSAKEFKSCMTIGYRMEKFKHLRKDKRYRHRDKWTVEELKKMLQLCGQIRRSEIAKEIDRSNDRVIKEKLKKLGLKSTFVNGLTKSYTQKISKIKPTLQPVGPLGQHLVTWIELSYDEYKDDILNISIKALANFQRWIFNYKPDNEIIRSFYD